MSKRVNEAEPEASPSAKHAKVEADEMERLMTAIEWPAAASILSPKKTKKKAATGPCICGADEYCPLIKGQGERLHIALEDGDDEQCPICQSDVITGFDAEDVGDEEHDNNERYQLFCAATEAGATVYCCECEAFFE
jgi:hypothetical protein